MTPISNSVYWKMVMNHAWIKKCIGNAISFLILCVDDILIIGYDLGALSSLRNWLSSQVLNEGLGDASYILEE